MGGVGALYAAADHEGSEPPGTASRTSEVAQLVRFVLT